MSKLSRMAVNNLRKQAFMPPAAPLMLPAVVKAAPLVAAGAATTGKAALAKLLPWIVGLGSAAVSYGVDKYQQNSADAEARANYLKKLNKDALLSYSGSVLGGGAGGGALGALIAGEGNRLKGGAIGATVGALAMALANYARRKYQYGSDVTV